MGPVRSFGRAICAVRCCTPRSICPAPVPVIPRQQKMALILSIIQNAIFVGGFFIPAWLGMPLERAVSISVYISIPYMVSLIVLFFVISRTPQVIFCGQGSLFWCRRVGALRKHLLLFTINYPYGYTNPLSAWRCPFSARALNAFNFPDERLRAEAGSPDNVTVNLHSGIPAVALQILPFATRKISYLVPLLAGDGVLELAPKAVHIGLITV